MKQEKMSYVRNLNFFELATITGTALGLPAMLIGGQLVKEYGIGSALISILIGNFILWIIGLGIISTTSGQKNAIQNVKDRLGNFTGNIAAIILSCAFLGWYTIQIEEALAVISPAFDRRPWEIGIVLGLIVTFLSIGNLTLIKKVCVFALPLLLGFSIYIFILRKIPHTFAHTWTISLPGILAVIPMWLPGIVNLPTIFRHSKSKADSVLGLSLMSIFHCFFQSIIALINIDTPQALLQISSGSVYVFLAVTFTLVAFLCINLINVYFASAAWETIFPQYGGYKKYAFIGLVGTVAYAILQNFSSTHQLDFPSEFLEAGMASFFASLGVVLLMDYLSKISTRHKQKPFNKWRGSLCWLMGCFASVLAQIHSMPRSNNPLLTGMLASFLAFLVMIFIEETLWSWKELRK